ncbi:MAG: TIGR01777 family oxidoreductase [Nitrosomonas sp.]|nr:MAG: TIGR01777 family oxidoreductase [Nitrosomonas sp.]
MNILITGATGFIGRRLVQRLQQPDHVIRVLSRNGRRAGSLLGVPAYQWDCRTEDVPGEAMRDCQVVINLMGENLGDGRWTEARKHEIYASRILSTRKLVAAAPDSLQTFVCGSAIGIYPGSGDTLYDESCTMPEQRGFIQTICHDWEQEAARIERNGVRRVSIRTGVVLGQGGMLQKLLPVFKLGLGGPVGSGLQWLPWIHIDDIVSVFANAALDSRYHGAINAVSPNPVRYREFAHALGKVLQRPAVFPVPALLLRLALGEAAALALNSYRIAPKRLLEELGFRFKYSELGAALEDLLGDKQ